MLSKMARKGRKRARSSKTIAKEKFPIGELARRRKVLKEEFISNCKVYSTESSKLKKLKRKARKSKFAHMLIKKVVLPGTEGIPFLSIHRERDKKVLSPFYVYSKGNFT